MGQGTLWAGIGREDITPPPGIHLSGYAGRPGPNVGCRDPLYASALFLSDGNAGAMLLSLDVIGLAPETDTRLRVSVGEELGIPPDAVLVACSHTHAGPATMRLRGTGEFEPAWTETVLSRAVRAAAAACRDAAPVALRHGQGVCFANINRRRRQSQGVSLEPDPHGPCDSRCRILWLERSGRPAGAVVHFAMHPVVLGNDNRRVSADWVGPMRARLEGTLGCPVLFLQGCCGDINPRVCHGEQFCDRVGEDVAGSVLSCLDALVDIERPALRLGSAVAMIPLRPLPPGDDLARVEQEALMRLNAGGEAMPLFARDLALADLEWAAACRAHHDAGPASVAGRVSALTVGPIALVGLPGEIFTEIGAQIEAAVSGAWPVGYANGNLGYLYPDQALGEGGYEVELAYRLYGRQQPDLGTAGALVRAAREAVSSARTGR